jgi:PAS domain S-box-containing protein
VSDKKTKGPLRGMNRWMAVLMLVVLIAGTFSMWWALQRVDRQMRDDLLQQARLVVQAVDINRFKALTGTEADLKNPDYQRLKEQLSRVRQANDKCRFFYLMARKADGKIIIHVDSEVTTSKDYSPPGQVYEEVPESYRRVFDTGTAAVEGPDIDRWGTWVSALVPLTDPTTGELLAVMGMDIDARSWKWDVASHATLPVSLMLVLVILVTLVMITARSRAKLLENKETLSSLINATNESLLLIDTKGKVLVANEVVTGRLGKHVGKLIGTSLYDYFSPDVAESRRGQHEKIVHTGKTVHFEDERSGRIYETYAYPVFDDTGNVCKIAIFSKDITENKRIEKELQESEERNRIVIDNSNDGIAIMKGDAHLYVNQRFVEIFGYADPAEIIGENNSKTVHPDDYLLVSDINARRQKKGEPVPARYEFKGIKKDTTPIYLDVSATATRYQGDCVSLVYLRDITDRKLAEEKLRLSEEKYRSLVSDVPGVVYRCALDPDWTMLFISKEIDLLSGYPPSDFINNTIRSFVSTIHPRDREVVNREVQEGVEKKRTYEMEYRINRADEGISWVHERGHGVFDSKGNLLYIEGIILDITEHKLAEEELHRERQKLKTISDNAPFGMILVEQEGHFTYINRKFTELFGYDLSDVPDGRTWCRKAYPDNEYRHAVISAWREDFGKTRPDEQKNVFTVTCKDGTEKVIQFLFSVLISGDSLMICEDITALRQLESQLRQSQKMEAIGTLAGGIAHDFNNILTALMGYAALIQMKLATTHPLRAYVDEVLSASEKAVDLTQSLLAFSRQQSVNLVPLNMNNTINETKKLLRRLLTEDIEFRTSLADDDMIVMADKSQMDQILFNLVTNARDAMPKGGMLTIETKVATIDDSFAKVHGFGKPGKYVGIDISDTGMGMDEQTRTKIFDPFFTTKEIGKGTGLGLATVYGIVKTHNGFITVESTLNKGSTFHIYLPWVIMKVGEAEEGIIPVTGGKETILIAEDNEGVRRFMREVLQKYGYAIWEATDGEDAIEKFKKHPDIDLIIIDSVMPRKNGRETYEEIHTIDPQVKVLFTSGYTKDIVLDKGIEEKEVDFIGKPMSLNTLLRKVREVLDR